MKYPIYIPSKGRASPENAKLIALLDQSRLDYTIFVEPQDEYAYRGAFGRASFVVLPDNDRGLGYSRQRLLEHARSKGWAWYWHLDDDIAAFHSVENGRIKDCSPIQALEYAEDLAGTIQGLAMLGLDFRQFAWSARGDFSLNRSVWVATLVNTATGLDYDATIPAKSDVDFLVKHLVAGWDSALIHRYAIGTPIMGKSKVGGMVKAYAEGKGEVAARLLSDRYPSVIETKPSRDGRGLNIKINWKHFKRPPRLAR